MPGPEESGELPGYVLQWPTGVCFSRAVACVLFVRRSHGCPGYGGVRERGLVGRREVDG